MNLKSAFLLINVTRGSIYRDTHQKILMFFFTNKWDTEGCVIRYVDYNKKKVQKLENIKPNLRLKIDLKKLHLG
jgi:hypothetical protein